MLIPKINSINVINLDEYESIITHWRALFTNSGNVRYFDSFGAEYIPKENKKIFITNIITNIYETQAYISIMCE